MKRLGLLCWMVPGLACGPRTPPEAAGAPPDAAAVAPTPPARARAPMLYFAMVDRFANGEPANDGAVDPADPHAFHGGDLQGLAQHLDHLDALGVTHLWVSPVFEMRTQKIDEWGAFHGYWVRDLAEAEPRFGGVEALRALSDGLHARQMKLVLDMVWNHTDYDAPLLTEHPDWYHEGGDIQDWNDPVERVTGRVHGLPDLAQERPEVFDYLRAVSQGWVDRAAVDGFRVDAVGHMPLPELRRLNGALDAHHPGFWTVGEDFSGDPARLAATLGDGGFDAVFDFPLRYAMIDVFCKDAPLGRLSSTLSLDRLYADPSALVTFLDNHDVPRVTTECAGSRPRASLALTFQMLSRGMPALTWGTEAWLPGGEEPDNRRDMPWSSLSDPDVARNLSDIRGLADLRTDWPVLQDGRTVILQQDADAIVVGRFGPRQAARLTLWRGAPPDADVPWPLAEGAERVQRRRWQDPTGTQALGIDAILVESESEEPPWSQYLEEPEPVGLTVRVAEADREGLVVVGAGPELGHWDPSRGVPVDADGQAKIALPGGTVAALKLVRRTAEGPVWAPGPDTNVHLPWLGGEVAVDAQAP